ncbi:MAG: MarR family EPS-associated transcriptional regulator [Parahaliea sp.]
MPAPEAADFNRLIPMSEETHFRVLRIIQDHPQITQRELACELGVSLGKTNYCLKALLGRGWIKANNFKNRKNKIAYAYLLTPKGIEAKARLTLRFLRRKMGEYETLKVEIAELERDVARQAHPGQAGP